MVAARRRFTARVFTRSPTTALWIALLLCGVAPGAQKYALIIGIGQYLPGQDLPELAGPSNDAQAVSGALEDEYGFLKKNIRLLLDGTATRSAILAALDELSARIKPGDY